MSAEHDEQRGAAATTELVRHALAIRRATVRAAAGTASGATHGLGDLVYARDDPGKRPGRVVSLALTSTGAVGCTVEWDDQALSTQPGSALVRILCARLAEPELPAPDWPRESDWPGVATARPGDRPLAVEPSGCRPWDTTVEFKLILGSVR